MATTLTLPLSTDEQERLKSLLAYDVLELTNEEQLNGLTRLTASIFNAPIVIISIIDQKRQLFKSNFGLTIREMERGMSICQYTILSDEILEVPDALEDERFRDSPLVTNKPFIRYYCGAPLTNEEGFKMGSLAILDKTPRKMSDEQRATLKLLAQQVVNFFELNHKRKLLEKEKLNLEASVAERTQDLEEKVIQLKQRDEKIISVNSELSRLIYRASHDLLGPLRTLQGLISLALLEDNIGNIHHYLKLIYTTEQKLDNALVNLLKLVAIKDASDFQPIHWEKLIKRALRNARKRVDRKPVILNQTISVEEKFKSDAFLLQIVFEELFINSIQYNLNDSVFIEVSVRKEFDKVIIDITDNGIGIREDERDRIFEMFFKNLQSRGSGLGLYITKNAVEKLKGNIRVLNATNAGATFRISLPFAHPELGDLK